MQALSTEPSGYLVQLQPHRSERTRHLDGPGSLHPNRSRRSREVGHEHGDRLGLELLCRAIAMRVDRQPMAHHVDGGDCHLGCQILVTTEAREAPKVAGDGLDGASRTAVQAVTNLRGDGASSVRIR